MSTFLAAQPSRVLPPPTLEVSGNFTFHQQVENLIYFSSFNYVSETFSSIDKTIRDSILYQSLSSLDYKTSPNCEAVKISNSMVGTTNYFGENSGVFLSNGFVTTIDSGKILIGRFLLKTNTFSIHEYVCELKIKKGRILSHDETDLGNKLKAILSTFTPVAWEIISNPGRLVSSKYSPPTLGLNAKIHTPFPERALLIDEALDMTSQIKEREILQLISKIQQEGRSN